ncbi:MAG: ABC transporter permease [Rhodobacteraceae bacterium]|nr:ABC transporter permease [Paracoccaceae bacterium]
MSERLRSILWFGASCLVLVAALGLWQSLAEAGIIPRAFFPGPGRVWTALERGFASGAMVTESLTTIRRMALGWALASVIGVGLGVLVGLSPWMRVYIAPSFEGLRPIPASALAPLAVLAFGLSDGMILALIAFGAVWPMLLTTVHGVTSVHPRKVEVAQALGLTRRAYAWKIALPAATPDILSGLRLGLTVALILAVVGEMITVQGGLGARIMIAARRFNAADIFAGIALLGVIGLLTNAALSMFEARLLRWTHR